MSVESTIKQALFLFHHSDNYASIEKVAKPSVFKGFQLVIDSLIRNLGLRQVLTGLP
jgi:hypothetical protein